MPGDEFDIFREKTSLSTTNPLSRESMALPDGNTLPGAPAGAGDRPVVLIIDDDAGIRESLQIVLRNKFKVIACADGDQGVRVVNSSVAAVILDIKMEKKDGFQTFAEIKQKFIHLPIIFHSAYQDIEDPYNLINEYRPFGYVAKEGSFNVLLGILDHAVNYHQKLRQNEILLQRLRETGEELQDTNKQLEEYNRNLESKVAKRTRELDQKNLELKGALQKVEEAAHYKSRFLADMGDEIRTPLDAILGLTDLVLGTDLDARQYDYLVKLKSSSRSLLATLNDILDMSKIEVGKLELESIDFDLEEVMENIVNMIGVKAEEKGIELLFDIKKNVPRYLVGDPLRLSQVLLNLSKNAVKFTEQGRITIKIERLNDPLHGICREVYLRFSVQDSGIGMSREQISRLFKPFSNTERSTTGKYGATGLGLAISKRLVEMMGGEIRVDSESNKGSTFSFTAKSGLKTKIRER